MSYHTYKPKAHAKKRHPMKRGAGFFDDFAQGFSQGLDGVGKIAGPLLNFATKFAGYEDGMEGGAHMTKSGRQYRMVNGHRRYLDSKASLRHQISTDARKLSMPRHRAEKGGLAIYGYPEDSMEGGLAIYGYPEEAMGGRAKKATAHKKGVLPKALAEYHAFRKMLVAKHGKMSRDQINAAWHKHKGKKGGSIITDLIGSFL